MEGEKKLRGRGTGKMADCKESRFHSKTSPKFFSHTEERGQIKGKKKAQRNYDNRACFEGLSRTMYMYREERDRRDDATKRKEKWKFERCVACGAIMTIFLSMPMIFPFLGSLMCGLELKKMDSCYGTSQIQCPLSCACIYCHARNACVAIGDVDVEACESTKQDISPKCGAHPWEREGLRTCFIASLSVGGAILLVMLLTICGCVASLCAMSGNCRGCARWADRGKCPGWIASSCGRAFIPRSYEEVGETVSDADADSSELGALPERKKKGTRRKGSSRSGCGFSFLSPRPPPYFTFNPRVASMARGSHVVRPFLVPLLPPSFPPKPSPCCRACAPRVVMGLLFYKKKIAALVTPTSKEKNTFSWAIATLEGIFFLSKTVRLIVVVWSTVAV